MAKKPETKFKEKVQAYLRTLPHCWFYKAQEVGRRGVPDLICCIRGRFVALELKVEGGKIDALQEYTLRQIQSQGGGRSFVVTPTSWSLVQGILSDLARGSLP